MLDLSEITARAKEAPRQTTDVEVLFDAGISEDLERLRNEVRDLTGQIEDIDASLASTLETLKVDLRASDSRPATVQTAAAEEKAPIVAQLEQVQTELEQVQNQAAEFLVTFRFTALHGFEWADLCAHSIPREGVAEDAGRAYNLDEVTKAAATRSGVRVLDDGQTIAVTVEQWQAVWETLPAPGLTQVKMAVWYLNEYAWVQARDEAVVAARKVSTARQAATPSSPSTSASTPGVSPDGNPRKSRTTSTTTKAA
jgi:hypothetical protein